MDTVVAPPSPAGATLPPPFDTLNAQQRDAVAHGDDPLLVVAGAGSGKTLMLAARVARLVLDGADPRRILLMTFSRRAAAELERRAGRLLHQALGLRGDLAPPQLPWAGTFHSVAARLLREHFAPLGLPADFTVVDRADAEELMALVRTKLDLHDAETRFPLARSCLTILSRVLNSQGRLTDVLAQHFPWCAVHEAELRRLFDHYTQAKQAQRVLDYDDLLLLWQLAVSEPAVAQTMAARFSHVLVDEYQDTNRLQDAILRALVPQGRGVTVVGDDAQAIYGFRAAEVDNLLGFPQRFTPAARVLMLERNYRSTQPILQAANAVIAQAERRFAKTLYSDKASSQRPQLVHVDDEAAQATWVADEVLRQREEGTRLTQQAVLFRTGHHSAALELELARRRIPFVKYGGLRFLEAAHVKDAVSLLRWTHNPRCRLAGFRVARLCNGIGPAAALKLLDALDASADPAAALQAWQPPARAATDWAALRDTCAHLSQPGLAWPADVQRALDWLLPQLPRLYGDDARARIADLEQLARLAAGYGSRERFLTELTLDPPEASSDESGPPHRDDDYLILSTIHSAKGQEWHSVHVLNVVDGCMPADMATGSAAEIEEERRLLYVAMTRAKERLHLLVPHRFHVTQQRRLGSRHLYAVRSRFIPSALDGMFDHVQPPLPGNAGVEGGVAAGDTGQNAASPTLDLLARLRRQGGLP